MIQEARCTDCGAWFAREAGETWKVRCLDCWKASKAAREGGTCHEGAMCRRCYEAGVAAGRSITATVPADRPLGASTPITSTNSRV